MYDRLFVDADFPAFLSGDAKINEARNKKFLAKLMELRHSRKMDIEYRYNRIRNRVILFDPRKYDKRITRYKLELMELEEYINWKIVHGVPG